MKRSWKQAEREDKAPQGQESQEQNSRNYHDPDFAAETTSSTPDSRPPPFPLPLPVPPVIPSDLAQPRKLPLMGHDKNYPLMKQRGFYSDILTPGSLEQLGVSVFTTS